MAMNGPQLADEMASAMGYKTTTKYLVAFGKGIVEEVKSGTATFGMFAGPHSISGISGDSMATKVMNYAGYPGKSRHLVQTCTAIADHVMSAGKVTYTGPPFPPPPPPGWYLGGTISGLSGPELADKIVSYVGYPNVSRILLMECIAIVTHIMTNAQVQSGVIS